MTLFFTQLLNGIENGVVYASLAIALVLIFRTTGILNFAQGEMALFSTYLMWKFTDHGMPVWLAILLAMVLSFIGGALIERVVIRPVERSSPLVIVIVTIGLFLAINSLTQLLFGADAEIVPACVPASTPGARVASLISSDTLVLVAVLAVECCLLYLLLQRTKLGLALRAVVSQPGVEPAPRCPGRHDPDGRVGPRRRGRRPRRRARRSRPRTGLTAASMQSILVFAFAAAALGGFDSVLGAVVGGMIVGVADALTIQYVDALDGIDLVVPFGLILLVLLFRPAGLFGKARVERV